MRKKGSREGKGRAGFSSSPVAVLAVVPSLVTQAALPAGWGRIDSATFDFGVSGRGSGIVLQLLLRMLRFGSRLKK